MTTIEWLTLGQLIVLAITAGMILWYTNETTKGNRLTAKISEADFIIRLDNNVFTERFTSIFKLIESKQLAFDDMYFRFLISTAYVRVVNVRAEFIISTYEMDDIVLGQFENIGILFNKNIIPLDLINEVFGYYIVESWENEHIKKYIEIINKGVREKNKYYSNFELIYNECKKLQA